MDVVSYAKAAKNGADIANLTQQITNHRNIFTSYFNPTAADGEAGDVWYVIESKIPTDYYFNHDASELELSENDPIATWEDLSTNGINLSQGTADNQPKYSATGLNGKPTVVFDGNDSLTNTSFTLPEKDAITYFAVIEPGNLNSNTIMQITGSIASNDRVISLRLSGTNKLFEACINISNKAITGVVLREPMLITISYNKELVSIYKNGALEGTKSYTEDIIPPAVLFIGRTQASQEFFTGKMSQEILYNRELTADELNSAHAFLLRKWGLV